MRSAVRLVFNLVDGQGHTVNRDRTFDCNEGCYRLVDLDPDPVRIAFGADAKHCADAIDMTCDDMPTQLVADFEGAFKIQPAPDGP